MIILGSFVLYNIGKMFLYAHTGYKSGNNNITDIDYGKYEIVNVKFTFGVELLFVVVLNALAPYLATIIRGEHVQISKSYTICFIAVVALCLQLMMQWTGLLKPKTKPC